MSTAEKAISAENLKSLFNNNKYLKKLRKSMGLGDSLGPLEQEYGGTDSDKFSSLYSPSYIELLKRKPNFTLEYNTSSVQIFSSNYNSGSYGYSQPESVCCEDDRVICLDAYSTGTVYCRFCTLNFDLVKIDESSISCGKPSNVGTYSIASSVLVYGAEVPTWLVTASGATSSYGTDLTCYFVQYNSDGVISMKSSSVSTDTSKYGLYSVLYSYNEHLKCFFNIYAVDNIYYMMCISLDGIVKTIGTTSTTSANSNGIMWGFHKADGYYATYYYTSNISKSIILTPDGFTEYTNYENYTFDMGFAPDESAAYARDGIVTFAYRNNCSYLHTYGSNADEDILVYPLKSQYGVKYKFPCLIEFNDDLYGFSFEYGVYVLDKNKQYFVNHNSVTESSTPNKFIYFYNPSNCVRMEDGSYKCFLFEKVALSNNTQNLKCIKLTPIKD
jgi:hypothetical protein